MNLPYAGYEIEKIAEMARRYAGYKRAIDEAEERMRARGSKTGPPPASAEFAHLVAERTKLAHAIAEEASRGLDPIPPDPAPRFRWEPPKVPVYESQGKFHETGTDLIPPRSPPKPAEK